MRNWLKNREPIYGGGEIAEARAKADIVAVVAGRVSLRRVSVAGGAEAVYRGKCPFHSDAGESLSVFARAGRFQCTVCGARGDAVDFVRRATGLSFLEAIAQVRCCRKREIRK